MSPTSYQTAPPRGVLVTVSGHFGGANSAGGGPGHGRQPDDALAGTAVGATVVAGTAVAPGATVGGGAAPDVVVVVVVVVGAAAAPRIFCWAWRTFSWPALSFVAQSTVS